ncbi:putative phospholipase B-like 2, partial [Saccoglossus kowalevskii]|uniref:Phospholipase B-like n=1 Tax=Saccoglossus kowalevskii TaxID=10224 RepID=A0ABM0MHN9_SACKO
VNLTLLQLMGMEDGYHNSTTKMNHTIQLQPFGFLLLQIDGDLEDLQSALGNKKQKRPLGGGSCSALIKMLPGNSDLYVSQVTWSAYQTMLRILKKYDFPFKEAQIKSSVIPGRMMSFSSAPGKLYSGDDFYIIGNGLVSLETTIGNSNDALWKYIKAKGQVLEWMRNIVSNRLAHNATMWADIFKQYNSGT